jgi:methyl-accepting chemotaxis protein
MVIQFTLQDLMIFLVCAFVIAAAALSLPILWNMTKMVGILRSLVETNQESINKTIRTMPGILENVGQISSDVRETTDKLKISVPVILQDVESVTNTAKESIELAGAVVENMGSGINETIAAYEKEKSNIVAYLHIFEEVLEIICRTFSCSK